jgi:F-box and leucine-rich repeat protein GRR1
VAFIVGTTTTSFMRVGTTDQQTLSPSRAPLADAEVVSIASSCRSLEKLDVSWCGVTDKGLTAVAGDASVVTRLRELRLQGCSQVTDAGVLLVARAFVRTLEKLDMFGCWRVTSSAIVEATTTCKRMTTLCVAQCTDMSTEAVVQLREVAPRLVEIDLRGCTKVADLGVRAMLSSCSAELRVLRLAQCPLLTDMALVGLSLCAQLHVLDLKGCKGVTGTGLSHLPDSTAATLAHLDLSGTGLTDASLDEIARRHRGALASLAIDRCPSVTARSVARTLGACRALRTLQMRGCTGIPTARARELAWLRPDVDIATDASR